MSAADRDLAARVPRLLERARALLRLPGGPADRLDKAEVPRAAQAVRVLHLGLVGERALARPATYGQAELLGAYLLWWWPQSYARVRAALELAPLAPLALRGRAVRVLDLGAGPGPGALAALDAVRAAGGRAEALAVDASAAALGEARALSEGAVRSELRDLAGAPAGEGGFDLALAANVLSELPGGPEERARWLRAAAARLGPGGALVVVEPALKETGRALLQARDLVLAGEAPLRALAPCFLQGPCPALAHPRDWCTADRPWEAPPHVAQLSRALGLHADAPLSYAPLVLAREVPVPAPDVWRVVGVPPEEKGKRRLFVCGAGARVAAARLDREASEANAPFGALSRGDTARLAGTTVKGDGLRVGRESRVERLTSVGGASP